MRRWLISVSVVFHFALIFGLFVAGLWRLERLDTQKQPTRIGWNTPPPPAAADSGPARPKVEFTKKQPKIVKETVQPTQKPDPAVALPSTSTGTGEGSGSGSGSGSGDPDDTGPCLTDCGQGSGAPQPEPKPVVEKATDVPPPVLRGLRISGETQIQPPDVVKTQIMRDGGGRLTGMFKVCLDAGGSVSSISLMKPTGYAGYDAELSRAIRDWRYRPYSLNGRSIPVCGVVTFIYSMK